MASTITKTDLQHSFTIRLTQSQLDTALALGAGQVSPGIRVALDWAATAHSTPNQIREFVGVIDAEHQQPDYVRELPTDLAE